MMKQEPITITYMEQPPKRYTFEQPLLKKWVEEHCTGRVLNLFAGRVKLDADEFRVDMDKEMPADWYGDAETFVNTYKGEKFDTIVLDPPYSLRKSREKYEGRYIGKFTKIKDNITKILKDGGIVISLGYSSTGMSNLRGFNKTALCVVCHSGDHDNTIGVVEEFTGEVDDKDLFVVCEQKYGTPAKQGSIKGIFVETKRVLTKNKKGV